MRPFAAMLKAFAEHPSPLNKYQLEKRSKVPRQSIYVWTRRMERLGWIKLSRVETARTGMLARYYELTDLGLYRAGATNPDISEKVRTRLGVKYQEFETKIRTAREQDIDSWLQLIKQVLLSGKASPGWSLSLDIVAKEDGRIQSRLKVGYDVIRHKATLSDSKASR